MRIASVAAFAFVIAAAPAWAQTPPTDKARPAGHPAVQNSVPNAAPPATTERTTGATDQNPTVKQMNATEKKKLETEGK